MGKTGYPNHFVLCLVTKPRAGGGLFPGAAGQREAAARLPGALPMWPRLVVGAGPALAAAGTRRHGRPQPGDGEIHGACAVVLVRVVDGHCSLAEE